MPYILIGDKFGMVIVLNKREWPTMIDCDLSGFLFTLLPDVNISFLKKHRKNYCFLLEQLIGGVCAKRSYPQGNFHSFLHYVSSTMTPIRIGICTYFTVTSLGI